MPANLNLFKSTRHWRWARANVSLLPVAMLFCAATAFSTSDLQGAIQESDYFEVLRAASGEREVELNGIENVIGELGEEKALSPLPSPPHSRSDWGREEEREGMGAIEELWRVPIRYHYALPSERTFEWGAVARAYYLHDQRYEFTGTESTFGAESQLFGEFTEPVGGGEFRCTGELYLTQPFDRNLLVDYPERASFEHNFEIEPFEISQLALDWNCGDWTVTCGRFVTPFGRYHLPLFANNRGDSAFIRSEAVLFRETGIQVAWDPNDWRMVVAMTNGSDGRDTNSSKAVVARCGVDFEHFVGGVSVKWQDGVGSEGQKEFKNHAGFDWLIRRGCWGIAGEFIYDQHGLRRPGLGLDEITWGRSLYNRQLNVGLNQPIGGLGYYSSLIYHDDWRTFTLGYGQFFPDVLGDPIHDTPTERLIGQFQWSWSERVSNFATAFWENEVPNAQAGRTRHGFYLLTGLQYTF